MLSGIVKGYINNIINENDGLKVILFDKETSGIVSTVFTMSSLLQKEVFLVDKIENELREEMPIFRCICILRPSAASIDALCKELVSPKYPEYYLCTIYFFYFIDFTNVLKKSYLDKLAQVDIKERVKSIKEYFMDFYTPLSHFFSLNLKYCFGNSLNTWNKESLQRTIDGISACIRATSTNPLIRFDKSSPMAYRLAEELSTQFQSEPINSSKSDQIVVLLLDRRSDLVTPLLSHWTYQSLLHELFELQNGRLTIKTMEDNQEKIRDYSLMEDDDEFYRENIFTIFGELGKNVKTYVENYREKTKKHSSLKEVRDMKQFINEYGAYKKMGLIVSRHVEIIDEITKMVTEKHLLELSEIEQTIASEDSKLNSDYQNVNRVLNIIDRDLQLKLLLLFYLKYKSHLNFPLVHSEIMTKLEALMPKNTLNAFLEYSEYEKREKIHHSSSFKDNLIQKGKATVSSLKENIASVGASSVNSQAIQDIANSSSCIYTQHKTACKVILESLSNGRLSETQFPFFASSQSKVNCGNFLVFFINGCTYEEARIASAYPNMLCGTTMTCNFDFILSEITQYSQNETLQIK